MPGIKFTTQSVPQGSVKFNGGLNSTAGPLSLSDNESPDLQNVDFNTFGSVVKRNGYTALNTTIINDNTGAISAFATLAATTTTVTSAGHGLSDGTIVQITGTTNYDGVYTISGKTDNTFVITIAYVADDATGNWSVGVNSDGLYWFEFDVSGTTTRKLVNIAGAKLNKQDSLDGTWDDETNGLTITADNPCDFATFLDTMYVVNGEDTPFEWDGTASSATTSTLPANVTKPKYVAEFNNYLFYAHVVLSGVARKSRFYWCNIKDTSTWRATQFIDVSKEDGQEITGIKVLGDRLIIFKSRSIYALYFTGDADIPFILPGGGKTSSSVGCVGTNTIQEVDNGLVFLSSDGFYFFDGNNSFKISDKITTTILGYNKARFPSGVSLVQKTKNRYWCALTSSGGATNDRIAVWDYFNNAWTIYVGLNASAMTITYQDGIEERPYFADYGGFTYRGDVTSQKDDYPANVATKITAWYKTNWKHFNDLVNQKGVPEVTIYYQTSNSTMSFGYSFDFNETGATNSGALPGTDYLHTFSTSAGTSVYGTAVYGTGTYARSGGDVKRRSLTGRGRVVQFMFGNNVLAETFQIDGAGYLPHLETNY